MKKRQAKTRKKTSKPSMRRVVRRSVIDPVPTLDGIEPSTEELRELEASVDLEQRRERALGLAREYPRSNAPVVDPLTNALKAIPGIKAVHARVLAQSLKQMGDIAHDLDEIMGRLANDGNMPQQNGELALAFQMLVEQFCTYADGLGEQLYDVFDRAKGLK